MTTILALLCFIGTFLHSVQGILFGFNKQTIPLFIWGIVLAVLGYFWLQAETGNWLQWTTLLMPLVGGFGLAMQLKKSTNPKWVDYGILSVDAITVLLMLYFIIK